MFTTTLVNIITQAVVVLFRMYWNHQTDDGHIENPKETKHVEYNFEWHIMKSYNHNVGYKLIIFLDINEYLTRLEAGDDSDSKIIKKATAKYSDPQPKQTIQPFYLFLLFL